MSITNLTLLLVDDDLFLHKIQTALLTKFGHQVEAVSSGEQAIQRLSCQSFDLILMDVMMPGMDGLETTRQIRKAGIRTPILALTGNDTPADRQAAREAGMNGYLTKPIRKEDLDKLTAQLF
ncbi:response regulator [Thiomicrospira microaerophila]|uniref:response regulator n=1 Tax=Thiomicrospira microaerophila TaxID=406020 RepID=UPI0005CA52C3|nr:response regulator [Thiomicrospira microaerophila]